MILAFSVLCPPATALGPPPAAEMPGCARAFRAKSVGPCRQNVDTMPYIRRNAEGALLSLHRQAEAGAPDFLPDEHPEVQAFVGRGGADGFEQLDADFIRVLEDLIDLLLRKNVINATDLPVDARKKLFARKGHRSPTVLGELNLLGERSAIDGSLAPDFSRIG